MTSLTVFKNDGLEILIDTKTGESFATQAAYARMSGVSYPAVRKRVEREKGSDIFLLKTAEIITGKGLQTVTLIPADIVFDWLIEDNPSLAKAMGKAGATVYLHQIAGYKVESSAITTPSQTASKPPIIDEVTGLSLIRDSLLRCGIKSELAEGVFLNGVARLSPNLAAEANQAHKLLAATTESELLLTPTSIGEKLGISNRKVNQLLMDMGLQVKNVNAKKGEPAYLATPKGIPYAANTIATGKVGDDASYQHLKWKENILDVLKTQLVVA